MTFIYKICLINEWEASLKAGFFLGSKVDIEDGFIHFSTKDQLSITISKHFFGQKDLFIIEFDTKLLESGLKWEKSRGDDLFPHFYGDLNTNLANKVKKLYLCTDGSHKLPENFFS